MSSKAGPLATRSSRSGSSNGGNPLVADGSVETDLRLYLCRQQRKDEVIKSFRVPEGLIELSAVRFQHPARVAKLCRVACQVGSDKQPGCETRVIHTALLRARESPVPRLPEHAES